MKAFSFRLDRVLKFYRQQELAQSGVIAVIERDLQEKKLQIEQRRGQQRDLHVRIREQHQTMVHEELTRSYAHIEFLQRMLAALEDERLVIQTRLDEERLILLEMSKRRRIVEELRGRRLRIHDEEVDLFERSLLDEANSRRILSYSVTPEVER